MKRAATHLLKCKAKIALFSATHLLKCKAKIALFSKLSNIYFDSRPPGADPKARQRSENPTPGELECGNPRGLPGGDGQAWN